VSELDDFLLTGQAMGDSIMGEDSLVIGTVTIPVVVDLVRDTYEGALGGLESQITATCFAIPANVPGDPSSYLKKRCTLKGKTYRIAEVGIGTISIQFSLASPEETR
jgi:hypothetical protein